jgi:tape measure domain-containing protein
MAIKFTAEMEMQQKAFDILLGSAVEGARVYGEVVRYAAETPYQLENLTQATKELLAFGSSSATVMDELRRLGDIAQNDAEKLESVVQAFGKVQARGVAHMRELNRFIMAGVPIIGELGTVMNKSMDELFSAVQKGNVSFNAVKQAVENLTNVGGKFYNMSKEMS